MANDDSTPSELAVFEECHALLCNMITDIIDPLMKYCMEEKLLTTEEEAQISAVTVVAEKLRLLLLKISSCLKAGDKRVFYMMLAIMRGHGGKETQTLADHIMNRLKISNDQLADICDNGACKKPKVPVDITEQMENNDRSVTLAEIRTSDKAKKLKPTEVYLNRLFIKKYASHWRNIGLELNITSEALDIIEANNPKNVEECCREMLQVWLQEDTEASWEKLFHAVEAGDKIHEAGVGPPSKQMTSIRKIEVLFAKTTNEIKEALIRNNVKVVPLIEQLCAISAVKNKDVPLFDKDIFKRTKSINEFWQELRSFWNIFDYELLEYVIEISDCREAREIFENFLSRIDPSVIENVDLVLHCKVLHQEGLLKPILRIKVNADKFTLSVKKRVEEMVSKAYDLEKYALRLQGIKKGCIELLYYISKPLKVYLLQFKVSEAILIEFCSYKIKSFCIDENELNIPSKIDDNKDEFLWFVHPKERAVDFTIVFSGITGMGKSTAGNFFLNKESFTTEEGFNACTDHCSADVSNICGKKVKIIDTPGFFDEFSSTENRFEELSRALTLAKDGIHAFAFVMRYDRFTKAHKEAIQQLQMLKGVLPFVFILLTHAKRKGVTTAETAEYIEQCLTSNRCAPGLRTLMEDVENRVIMLEAVDFIAENYHQQKCNELVMMVEKIHKRNGDKVYTNTMLQHTAMVYEYAKQQQREEIGEIIKSLELSSQRIEQLKQQMNDTAINADNKAAIEVISKDITVLQKQNEDLEKELEQIKDEQYLMQLTNKIQKEEMSSSNVKGSFLDFVSPVSITIVGGLVGVGIGILGGPRAAGIGAGIGAVIGGAIATFIRDKNCNQQ